MDDKEYIEQLENLVIFLADIYTTTSRTLEKELFEKKSDAYLRIPTIQGLRSQLAIKEIASFNESLKDDNGNVKYQFRLDSILSNMKEKYNKGDL